MFFAPPFARCAARARNGPKSEQHPRGAPREGGGKPAHSEGRLWIDRRRGRVSTQRDRDVARRIDPARQDLHREISPA